MYIIVHIPIYLVPSCIHYIYIYTDRYNILYVYANAQEFYIEYINKLNIIVKPQSTILPQQSNIYKHYGCICYEIVVVGFNKFNKKQYI